MKRYRVPILLLVLLGILVAPVLRASTSPEGTGQAPAFTFAVFGDNRPATLDGAQPGAFRDVLRSISAYKPAFVVNTGDCIYGSSSLAKVKEQYRDYNSTVASFLTQKVYLALGNHEIQGSKANEEFFAKELGGRWYSFDHEDSHFIVLDSDVVGQKGRITGEQFEWLRQDLQKSRAARFKFVFLHMPLYPVDGHTGNCLDKYPKDRDALHSLFVRSRITAVCVGHEHLFDVQRRNGVTYIITGGGGAFTFPSTRGGGDFHHFVLASVDGDKVEMKVVRPATGSKPEEVIPVSRFLER